MRNRRAAVFILPVVLLVTSNVFADSLINLSPPDLGCRLCPLPPLPTPTETGPWYFTSFGLDGGVRGPFPSVLVCEKARQSVHIAGQCFIKRSQK